MAALIRLIRRGERGENEVEVEVKGGGLLVELEEVNKEVKEEEKEKRGGRWRNRRGRRCWRRV